MIDTLDYRLDYQNAIVTSSTGKTLNSNECIINYNSESRTVTATFTPDFLALMPMEGETYNLIISTRTNTAFTSTTANTANTIINDYTFNSNTVHVNPAFKITTEAINGTISSSIYDINKGENRNIDYFPNSGYMLKEVIVDGVIQDIKAFKDNYLFNNINSDHHIKVVYEPIPEKDITITKIWRDFNNKYQTRPDFLNIDILQNGSDFKTVVLNSITSNTNIWQKNIKVPLYDKYRNPIQYSIREQITPYLALNYIEPIYDQKTLTVTNEAFFAPMDAYPGYQITIRKDIINSKNQIANKEDFDKIKLDVNGTYKFSIILKEQERKIINDKNQPIYEEYGNFTGTIYKGIVTNKGDLIFNNIPAGKYEIMEEYSQYFDFVNFEKLSSSSNAILTKENGKYFITLPGLTAQDEEITIKVINKIHPVRPYDKTSVKNNIFKK